MSAPPIELEEPLALSFAQERLWFLHQLEPEGSAYHLPAGLRLRGPLDVDALARALARIVARHEVLRTTFTVEQGRPVQVVRPADEGPHPLVVEDLRSLAAPARAARVAAVAEDAALRPFDLEHGPLLRVALLQVADDERLLFLTLHHIVADAWSLGIFTRELATLYREAVGQGGFAPSSGEARRASPRHPPTLPDLAIQYADYALWQREWLAGKVLAQHLGYFTERLAGAPASIDLPYDRPRPRRVGTSGATVPIVLDGNLTASLRKFGQDEAASLYMVLLAGYAALLGRYGGQTDVVVGSPIANRARPELEDLIGFFANTLVLRLDLSGTPTFRELLRRVREVTLDAFAHQDVPFEKIVEALRPERALGRMPLVPVLFTFQNAPGAPAALGDLTLTPLEATHRSTKVDLSLFLTESPAGLAGELEYRPELFDAATIERIVAHLGLLLASAVARPDERLSDLPLLSPVARRELSGWHAAPAPVAGEELVHRLFEATVARCPDAVALVAEGEATSYRALDARANQLAHHLRALGVGAEARVGLRLPRTRDAIVAILGILKAGAAYVPVDPEHPAARVSAMLADAGCSVLLTLSSLGALDGGWRTVNLDGDGAAIAARPTARPEVSVAPDQLAYVLYTSGSSGRPKGVGVSHRSVASYARGLIARLEVPAGWAFGHVSTLAADLGNTSLYGALASGGALHLLSPEQALDAALFAEYTASHPLDALKIVPGHLRALLASPRPERVLPRRLLVLGGEACPWELVERVRAIVPDCLVVNHYGPSETTVGVAIHPLRGTARSGGLTVPIGSPLPGAALYVCDANLSPVPVGVAGELYVGGPGVARGYLGRPERTAASFVPDVLSGTPGARLYRTGDRVRRLADGTIEFLGRLDHQLKIRGNRVELGEIEAALRRSPAVAAAVVVPVGADEPRLVAYWVRAPGAVATSDAVRDELARDLPGPMVPAAFVELDALPLTKNGKLDRAALPAPDWGRGRGGLRPPRTPAEQIVAAIWCELLGVDAVDRDDDFFERGGHSLLATQVLSRVNEAFSIALPLRVLFESRTLSEVAAAIDAARVAGTDQAPQAITRLSRSGTLPLSFAQERMWVMHQLDPTSPAFNLHGAILLDGAVDVDALTRSFAAVVARHEPLRTTFSSVAGRPVQVIHPPTAGPRIESIDVPAERVHEIEAAEALQPFDLARGPLLRVKLLRTGPDRHVFVYTMHHIVSDAWSRDVFVRELAEAYGAIRRGEPAFTQGLALQYVDYAGWQRSWLSGERLEVQLEHWRRRLAGAPTALELPTDHPRPPVQSGRGAEVPVALPKALRDGIWQLAAREGATPYMVLLAAYQTLLHRYTGETDLVVGSPSAGRNRAVAETMIGFFVNQLVFRTDLSGDPTFVELLHRVRDVTLDTFSRQDVPYEKIVDAIGPPRDPSRQPLVQVIFTFHNTMERPLDLEGVRVGIEQAPSRTSKVDLLLELVAQGEGLAGRVEYSTDLFERATVERFVLHLGELLADVVEHPGRRLSAARLLPADERGTLLEGLNATARDFGHAEPLLHRLFEEQARRTPEAIAVAFEGTTLTYAELDRRSNQLARHLGEFGVGPGMLVGLCLDRSLEMPIGLLGILKAGAAYVPLDPAYPVDRLSYMLEDSGAAVLVTSGDAADRVPDGGRLTVMLDGDAAALARHPVTAPSVACTPDGLAYVIYTSGSTGRPKGAMNTHRGIVNYLSWLRDAFPLGASDKVLQQTSFSFDISAAELYWPLLTGATLVLARPGGHMELGYLCELIQEQSITATHFVPSTLRALMAEDRLTRCTSLRRIITGGEALTRELANEFFARLGADLENLYGPTETAVDVTSWSCERGGTRTIPIGRPIANTTIRILDRRQGLAPIGVPGELCVGGVSLGRGYHARADLTAEKFIPDPFTSGARLYRTGDRARWLADGTIEFLGRLDDQVKVRGYRIELGEIEAALAEHPSVARAAVIVREDVPGERRLVAYVVREPQEGGVTGDLRAALRSRLPEYMVPVAFVDLDALPITPNGKLDRRALPAPEPVRAVEESSRTAPRSATEATLARIWCSVLRLEAAGIDDNFFELGGDSILIIQVVARASEAGLVITPWQMFQHQTIAELAVVAGTTLQVAAPQEPVTGAVRLLPIVRWFIDLESPAPAHYNQAVLLEVRRPVARAVLETAVAALIAHHDALRLRLVRTDGTWQQVIVADPGPVPFEAHDLSTLGPAQRRAAIEARCEQLQTSLSIEEGPLLRVASFDLGQAEPARLFITIHHLAVDGVSWRVLLEDLERLVTPDRPGHASWPPRKTSSIQAWADRLAEHARSAEVTEELAYWRSVPDAGAATLPLDAGANPAARGLSVVTIALEPGETQALVRDVPQAYGTQINDVLLLALVEAVARWTGRRSLQFDLEGHGREARFSEMDLTRTVGWFTTVYPVRLDLGKASEAADALVHVKETLRRIPRNGLGYGLLRYLGASQALATLPASPIVFNYLGQLDRALPEDALFGPAPESSGTTQSPSTPRAYVLDVNAAIHDQRLNVSFSFAPSRLAPETVASVARYYGEALRAIIEHCLAPEAGGFSPSDFPLVKLDQGVLDQLVQEGEDED